MASDGGEKRSFDKVLDNITVSEMPAKGDSGEDTRAVKTARVEQPESELVNKLADINTNMERPIVTQTRAMEALMNRLIASDQQKQDGPAPQTPSQPAASNIWAMAPAMPGRGNVSK